jgi:hypothetical protein
MERKDKRKRGITMKKERYIAIVTNQTIKKSHSDKI